MIHLNGREHLVHSLFASGVSDQPSYSQQCSRRISLKRVRTRETGSSGYTSSTKCKPRGTRRSGVRVYRGRMHTSIVLHWSSCCWPGVRT